MGKLYVLLAMVLLISGYKSNDYLLLDPVKGIVSDICIG